ncbi:tetratricopeptide repeat protein [Actinomycetes bacterium KLBMP 9797]
MELRVLGPVEMHAGGHVLDSGRPQQQVLLAVLAVEAGRLVSAESLMDRVSGQAPPKRASQLLHTHITRIRRMLERAEEIGGDPVRLARRTGGYMLEMPPHQVDVHRFYQLVRRARGDQPAHERVGLLREALDLWRGEPLAGLSGPWVETTRQVWRQQRLAAVIAWAHAMLDAGEPSTVIEPLVRELADHPLAEPLVVVLMRALAATGRSAEALEHYATLRRRLTEELGTDPGTELQSVHRAILRGEQAAPAAPPPEPPARTVVPAQLPADVRAFTGRARELAELDAFGTEPSAETKIAVVSGTAGVGKTALAIHWAHRVADRFPDGQLYVNLRGFAPEQPMVAADALARFLAALGVASPDIPPEVDERAARYRSELAGRRMLIVLDNAASSEQVRPLLPGSGTCVALVTSRDSLAGLVAVHGAHRLDLDPLPEADALALVRRLVGRRAAAESGAAVTLVHRCVRLPLALRVAAELVVSRPAAPLSELVEELADQQHRLSLLDAGGDPRAAVAAVLSWSVRHLPPDAARVFRLLGGHPGGDIDGYGVAALVGTDLPPARRTLDRLARAHLVYPTAPGRYGMHDLLRAYAIRLSRMEDSDGERRAALDRLFAYYLATAAAAIDRLHPAEKEYRSGIPETTAPVPDLADAVAARRWLDAERSCLVAVAAHGRAVHAVGLSSLLYSYLDGGYHADALAIHAHAHRAARRAGDPAGEAHALRGLGTAHMRLGRYRHAVDHFRQALALFRQAADRHGEIRALNGLGLVGLRLGWLDATRDHHQQALSLARQSGDRLGEVRALNGLGITEQQHGRYLDAVHHHEQALVAARLAGDRTSEAIALDNMGLAEQQLGRHGAAAEHHEQALRLARMLGNRTGEAHVLDNLGTCQLRLGQVGAAVRYFERALAIFREVGDRRGQTHALNGLGEAARAAGDPVGARVHHEAALSIARDIGLADQEARATAGLNPITP